MFLFSSSHSATNYSIVFHRDMAYRVILLFILVILVTDVLARRSRNRRTCRGICKDKEDQVIATRRPRSNGSCVAFVCRNCRPKRQRISDCWEIYEDLAINGKDKAKCVYEGKELPEGRAVEFNEGVRICLEGKLAMLSLASHFGAYPD